MPTKDMAADRRVGEMEDRPRAHDGLRPLEEVLHLQKVAVAQNRPQRWCGLGVGSQHEDPVEPRLLGELAGVDLE
jgi:hypothetical protein